MKAYLGVVETSCGPQLQVLYDHGGRFVGHPDGWQPAAKRALPDLLSGQSWTVYMAHRWCELHPNEAAV